MKAVLLLILVIVGVLVYRDIVGRQAAKEVAAAAAAAATPVPPAPIAITPRPVYVDRTQVSSMQRMGGGDYGGPLPTPPLSASQQAAKKMGLQGSALDQKPRR